MPWWLAIGWRATSTEPPPAAHSRWTIVTGDKGKKRRCEAILAVQSFSPPPRSPEALAPRQNATPAAVPHTLQFQNKWEGGGLQRVGGRAFEPVAQTPPIYLGTNGWAH